MTLARNKSATTDSAVDNAGRQLYSDGYHSFCDLTAEDEEVTSQFASNIDLLLAAMQRRDQLLRADVRKRVECASTDQHERILAVFDIVGEVMCEKDFNGCLFINVAAEVADPTNPLHIAAASHKARFQSYLVELIHDAEFPNASELGDQLMILIDGALVTAKIRGHSNCIESARSAATQILNANKNAR